MTRYAMAIDVEACIGCHTCTIACKSNNNLPNGVLFNKVQTIGGAYMDTASGTYPNDLHKKYYPVACQHCSKPACAQACPVGAITSDERGVVQTDFSMCIGCGSCVTACPYEARTLLDTQPEYVVDFPLGDWDAPVWAALTAVKCDFCTHRLDRGEMPACMELCLGRARYWGDVDDPDSEISKVLANSKVERFLEEAGTEPNCFYIVK